MANEKRLIDANALLAEITGMKVIDPYKKMRGLGERWVRSEGYDILIQLVKHFPTVDAVEVVRCKDCKFYQLKHYVADGIDRMCCENNKGIWTATPEDAFCSYGERKDNES